MTDTNDPFDRHSIAAARGCAVALCLGGCVWLVIGALIVWVAL